MNLWEQLRGIAATQRLIYNSDNLGDVLTLVKTLRSWATEEDVNRIAETVSASPETLTFIERRTRFSPYNLEDLDRYPEGALGHAFVRHCRGAGIDPNDLNIETGDDDLSFIVAHVAEVHDIWHVLTGFRTNITDEIGLQAFTAAQTRAGGAIYLVAGGLLNGVATRTDDLEERMAAISSGWEMGLKAKRLFGMDWRELWAEPLDALQRELNIKPVSHASPV